MKAVWTLTLAAALLALGSVVGFPQPETSRAVIAHMEGTVVMDGLRIEAVSLSISFERELRRAHQKWPRRNHVSLRRRPFPRGEQLGANERQWCSQL